MGGCVRAASRSASFGHAEKKSLVSFPSGFSSNTLKPGLVGCGFALFCLQPAIDEADDSCLLAGPGSGLVDRGILVLRLVAGEVTVNVAVIDKDLAAGAA